MSEASLRPSYFTMHANDFARIRSCRIKSSATNASWNWPITWPGLSAILKMSNSLRGFHNSKRRSRRCGRSWRKRRILFLSTRLVVEQVCVSHSKISLGNHTISQKECYARFSHQGIKTRLIILPRRSIVSRNSLIEV